MNDFVIRFQQLEDMSNDKYRQLIIINLKKSVAILEQLEYLPDEIFLLCGGIQIGHMGKENKRS